MFDTKKILICGGTGMVGGAIKRALETTRAKLYCPSRKELDLLDQYQVREWMMTRKPDLVFMAAGKVGGIAANMNKPAEFIYENNVMAANLVHFSWQAGVEKLLYFGSSCIYPSDCQQPMTESMLMTGKLHESNTPYALAKLSGLTLCQSYNRQYGTNFISCLPCNLYGPGDNYAPESSHVPAALIRRFDKAVCTGQKTVTVWGTGKPRREFLHVDDLAKASLHLMKFYRRTEPVNIGTGEDIPIRDFAEKIAKVTGFQGNIVFDASRPDGIERKCLDISKIKELGWRPEISLDDGLQQTYEYYRKYERQNLH